MDRARTFLAGVKSNGNLLGMGRRYNAHVKMSAELSSASPFLSQRL